MASTTNPAGTYVYQGETKQGYIKDGKTYTDENYTTEVPVGSTVYTNDGPYIKSGGGGLKMDETPIPKGNGVRYTDNGVAKSGYMQNGITYTDKNMTQRVPNGAIVQTAGGTYEMTANGGVPTAQTVLNDFKNQSNAYMDVFTAAKKAQEQQIKNSVNAALERLKMQKKDAEQQKEEADRAAHNAYLRAINPYGANAQQMASLGLGGSGFSETNLANIGNQYQQNLNNNALALDKTLTELNIAISEAKALGDEQRANLLTAYAQNIANMNMDAAKTLATLSLTGADSAYSRSRDVVSNAANAANAAQNRELNTINTAVQLIDRGFTPESVAKILNLSPDMFNAISGYYARQII